jgi:hypothetical protein
MDKHEQALAGAVALVACGPETSPLAQGVGGVGCAVANGLVDAEVHFDEAGGAVDSGEGTNGGDFADEDDAGGVGDLVECFFDGLGWSGLLSVSSDAKYRSQDEKSDCVRKIMGSVSGGHTYFFVRVTRIEACDLF